MRLGRIAAAPQRTILRCKNKPGRRLHELTADDAKIAEKMKTEAIADRVRPGAQGITMYRLSRQQQTCMELDTPAVSVRS